MYFKINISFFNLVKKYIKRNILTDLSLFENTNKFQIFFVFIGRESLISQLISKLQANFLLRCRISEAWCQMFAQGKKIISNQGKHIHSLFKL